MFPARAGMSREAMLGSSPSADVPRASGDEPDTLLGGVKTMSCSPHERG